jgi:hypothetical protein
MTVNTTNITSGPYTGNNVTTEFSYTFRVEDKDQLKVYSTTQDGVSTEWAVDVDYTVTGIGNDNGGIITATTAPSAGVTIFIRSDYKYTQLTDFDSQGGFFPDVHEASFDKLNFLIQQLRDIQNRRTLMFDDSLSRTSAQNKLPPPEVNKAIVWDVDGSLINSNLSAGNNDDLETYDSMASFITASPTGDNVNITSYYGGWAGTVRGPVGAHKRHKTGATNIAPSAGSAVSVSTIGSGDQAGYAWDATGNEWFISIDQNELNAASLGVHHSQSDNLAALQDTHTLCERYGLNLRIPSSRVSASTVDDINISAPWQINHRMTIVGYGEDTRIRKTTNAVGSGSNTRPERAGSDSYAVDAVIIVQHSDDAFSFECDLQDFRVYGNGGVGSIGVYAPRFARSDWKNVQTNGVEYGFVTFSCFTCTFTRCVAQDPTGELITGFDWRNDGTNNGTGTSCTFTGCYSFGSVSYGYHFYGLTYSTWNSVACDNFGDGINNIYAYYLENCTAFTMNSCGAETGKGGGFARLVNSTGVINTAKTFNCTALNNSANILTSSGSDVTIHNPYFSDWASVTGTVYDIRSTTVSDRVKVCGGRLSSNSTTKFTGGTIAYELPSQSLISGNNGDSDLTLTTSDEGIQRFASTLTADRTITLPTASDGWQGARFSIVRITSTPGSFSLDVGGLYTIPSDTQGTVVVIHNGLNWVLENVAIIP